MNLDDGVFFSLTGIAAASWRLVDGTRDLLRWLTIWQLNFLPIHKPSLPISIHFWPNCSRPDLSKLADQWRARAEMLQAMAMALLLLAKT